MLSTTDLERLIAVKRREIEKEKTRLGLPIRPDDTSNKENAAPSPTGKVSGERVEEQNERAEGERETEEIPADLERYIRRYLGLPVMLKAGEYSPNNPLIRGERPSGDALLGLGEYERRRNTLRKLRQQQYKEYLDQQAKKKQEEKEKAERERREREQREREREERERERELERLELGRVSPERPRAHTNTVFSATQTFANKVDTGVQTNSVGRALSVAVQTDDAELYRLCAPPLCARAAERDLSPRAPAPAPAPAHAPATDQPDQSPSPRYRPSLLDAGAVQRRNAQADQEAAAKRQSYQQELKNQIQEQQRIREERKAREKLLEAAETRRLEEQLRMLRDAQELERNKYTAREVQMKENATDYEKKRTALQKEIDLEQQSLFRAPRLMHTSHSDGPPKVPSKLPFYYPSIHKTNEKKHFSTNISDNSIFSPNYDVDSYLRKNLNPSKEILSSRLDTSSSECLASKYLDRYRNNDRFSNKYIDKEDSKSNKKVVVEALVHDRPKYAKENDNPIPVLRHSPVSLKTTEKNTNLSEAMQVVDDKWKVPAVQKNILKSLPNEEGKNVSILTQLGSIRRQLQLEQLKLDEMLTKE